MSVGGPAVTTPYILECGDKLTDLEVNIQSQYTDIRLVLGTGDVQDAVDLTAESRTPERR